MKSITLTIDPASAIPNGHCQTICGACERAAESELTEAAEIIGKRLGYEIDLCFCGVNTATEMEIQREWDSDTHELAADLWNAVVDWTNRPDCTH